MASIKYFIFGCLFFTLSCASSRPKTPFKETSYEVVDYSNANNWAALPSKKDLSDETPEKLPLPSEPYTIDVFFVYPTIYYGGRGKDVPWNADINDKKLNKRIDESTILFQASAFNQVGNVYVPRYRQAHLSAYFSKDKASAHKAFELAYSDVKHAFQYFIEHYNHNKPFIIASHSQGTQHAERLLEELVDKTNLKNRLVAAYLIGMPIRKNRYENIRPCADSLDTGCYVSWRTFKNGYDPAYLRESDIQVTNPLSWTSDTTYIAKEKNPGTILKDFYDAKYGIVDAKIHKNILWANKPKFKGSIFFTRKNFHIADINFYYFSIRNNAKTRAGMFWKR